MTRRISRARDQARVSQQQAEEQRAYLEAVLAHLSSGVLTLDQDGTDDGDPAVHGFFRHVIGDGCWEKSRRASMP